MGYIMERSPNLQPRFDVIEVFSDPNSPMKAKEIRHLENAFGADGSSVRF